MSRFDPRGFLLLLDDVNVDDEDDSDVDARLRPDAGRMDVLAVLLDDADGSDAVVAAE